MSARPWHRHSAQLLGRERIPPEGKNSVSTIRSALLVDKVPVGGSATVNGVLYQTLAALSWAARLSLQGVVDNGELLSATLVIEPAGGGGDLRVDRFVDQLKSKSGGGTHSFRFVLDEVLPDLYRAVPNSGLGRAVKYRLVTEARRGDWLGAEQFFRGLGDEVPDEPLSSLSTIHEIVVGRGQRETPFSLFQRIVTSLREHPHIKNEPWALTVRKTWHLLARFEFVGEQLAGTFIDQVERFLGAVISDRKKIAGKRLELYGWVLENVARGPLEITPAELLSKVNLSIDPLIALAQVDEQVRRCLQAAHRQVSYHPSEDVRPVVHWEDAKRILVFAGQSGQGKTWRLARTAAHCASNDLVALVPFTDNARLAWSDANDLLWQRVLRFEQSAPVSSILPHVREHRPNLATSRVDICIDDVQDWTAAEDLVRRVFAEDDGVRLMLTVPPEIGFKLRTEFPGDVQLVEVGDFTLSELRRFLAERGQVTSGIPPDVLDTLHRPLLAQLYHAAASDATWTPTTEYELYERFWRRLRSGRDQFAHPHDADRLASLAASIVKPDSVYPWRSSQLLDAGIDSAAARRFESLGWLQRTAGDGFRIFHDRLLNWAVAEGLVEARRRSAISLEELVKQMKRCSAELHAGKRLAYVPMDVLWLASGPDACTPADTAVLIAGLEGDYAEMFYSRSLPTLGERIIPAIVARARIVGSEDDGPPARFLATALAEIGRAAAQRVVEEGANLLKDESPLLKQAGLRLLRYFPNPAVLDRLWQHQLDSEVALQSDDGDRFSRHETTFMALRSAVNENVEWLLNKIRRAPVNSSSNGTLAYLLASLRSPSHDSRWNDIKEAIFAKVPSSKARSIVACVDRFRDLNEVSRLESWLDREDDWIAGHALVALAKMAPDLAIASLPRVPKMQLVLMRQSWMSPLLAQRPDALKPALLTLLQEAGEDFWTLATVYEDFPTEIDDDTFEVLLNQLETDVTVGTDESDRARQPLYRALSSFVRIWAPELLDVLRKRAGSTLEEKLTTTAIAWLGRSGVSRDHELDLAKLLLLKIGGTGFSRVVNAELGHSEELVCNEGLKRALVAPDEETRVRIRAVSARPLDEKGRVPRLRRIALNLLASLGDDDAVIASVLTGGLGSITYDLVDIRREQPPMRESLVADLSVALAGGDDEARERAVLAAGLTRRVEFVPLLLLLLAEASSSTSLAFAHCIALDWLGCKDDSFVSALSAQLTIRDRRRDAANCLLRVNSSCALDALLEAVSGPPVDAEEDADILAALVSRSETRTTALSLVKERVAWSRQHRVPQELWRILGEVDDVETLEDLRRAAFGTTARPWTSAGERIAAIDGLAARHPDDAYAAAEHAFETLTEHRESLPARMVRLRPVEAATRLIRHASQEKDLVVLAAIGRALREADEDTVADEFARLLDSNDYRARRVAAELGSWVEVAPTDADLQALLLEPSYQISGAARQALGRRRDNDLARLLVHDLEGAIGIHRAALIDGILAIADPFVLSHAADPTSFGKAIEGDAWWIREYVDVSVEKRKEAVARELKTFTRRRSSDL